MNKRTDDVWYYAAQEYRILLIYHAYTQRRQDGNHCIISYFILTKPGSIQSEYNKLYIVTIFHMTNTMDI